MLAPCHALSADLLWHIWLLYYYLSIALRENILKANGSEIHGWWFMHHYISMVPKQSTFTRIFVFCARIRPPTPSGHVLHQHHLAQHIVHPSVLPPSLLSLRAAAGQRAGA
jgi:hypothetical protein